MIPTDADFADLERRIGGRLPGALRAELRMRNGFWIEHDGCSWRFFPVRCGSTRQSLSKTAVDIEHETTSARDFGGLPPGWVAVAGAAAVGRWLVLENVDGRLSNEVYDWSRGDVSPTRVADHVLELLTGG